MSFVHIDRSYTNKSQRVFEGFQYHFAMDLLSPTHTRPNSVQSKFEKNLRISRKINSISEGSNTPGWYDISGTIENESGASLIAMALANGQYMFTSNPIGKFYLTVPLDSNDEITFYGFCSGLSPYKIISGVEFFGQL